MRIKMNTTMAGPTGVVMPGSFVEVMDREADDLIRGGYATAAEIPVAVSPLRPAPVNPPVIPSGEKPAGELTDKPKGKKGK